METNTIAKRLLSGSILRTMLLLCNVAVSFFMMPFLIHALGDRLYGFWALIGAFIGYYGFFDLGLSSAVSRFVSRAYGEKNYDEMNKVINTSLVIFSLIGIIIIIISIVTAILCPYFIDDYNEVILFRKIIIVLGLSVAIEFPMRAFLGVLISKLRYDLTTYLSLFNLILRTAFVVYFITNGYGILALAIITFVVGLIGHLIQFVLVTRDFKQIEFRRRHVKFQKIKSLFNYGIYSFISTIAYQLRHKVDAFVIAGFLNISLVTHYNIATRLIAYFAQLIVSAVGVMTPVFSQLEGRGDYDSIRKWLLFATKISTIVCVFVGSSIIFYGKAFIERWMGQDYMDSYYVLVILCATSTIGLIQTPGYGLLYGISKHKFFAIVNICEAATNLILSIILVRYYGMYGVAFGTMIPGLVSVMFVLPIYICRVINLSFYKYYFKTIFLNALKSVVPLVIYYLLVRDILKPSYITIFSLSFIQTILFLPFVFFLILNKNERQSLVKNTLRN